MEESCLPSAMTLTLTHNSSLATEPSFVRLLRAPLCHSSKSLQRDEKTNHSAILVKIRVTAVILYSFLGYSQYPEVNVLIIETSDLSILALVWWVYSGSCCYNRWDFPLYGSFFRTSASLIITCLGQKWQKNKLGTRFGFASSIFTCPATFSLPFSIFSFNSIITLKLILYQCILTLLFYSTWISSTATDYRTDCYSLMCTQYIAWIWSGRLDGDLKSTPTSFISRTTWPLSFV